MKELTYFRFTIQEWQNGDISDLPDRVQGAFINICAFYWASNCEVKRNKLEIKFKKRLNSIRMLYEYDIIKHQGEYITIDFLDEQLSELNESKKFFSKMGKLGQKAKKSKAPLKPPLSPPKPHVEATEYTEYTEYTEKTKKRKNDDFFLGLIPEDLKKDGFVEVWKDWVQFRKELKKKLTVTTVKQQLKFLTANPRDAKFIIQKSIQNGWQGLFPLKPDEQSNGGWGELEWLKNDT